MTQGEDRGVSVGGASSLVIVRPTMAGVRFGVRPD